MLVVKPRDEKRLVGARRLLLWGSPVLGVLLLPLAATLEQSFGLQALFHWRGEIAPPANVLVLAIDGTDGILERPDRRAIYASVIDGLTRAQASVIVVDMFLESSTPFDGRLAQAIDSAGNVIIAARLSRSMTSEAGTLIPPVEPLYSAAVTASPWMVPEELRVDWVFQHDESSRLTIPFVALHLNLHDDFMTALRAVRPEIATMFPQSRTEIPAGGVSDLMRQLTDVFSRDPAIAAELRKRIDETNPGMRSLVSVYASGAEFRRNRVYPKFYGAPRTIRTVSFSDVVEGAVAWDEGDLAGTTVFIGFSARGQPGQQDDYAFVYSSDGFNISGVEIAATTFANLMQGETLSQPTLGVRSTVVFVWGLLLAASFGRLRLRPSLLAGVLLLVLYFWSAATFFTAHSLWLPLVVPALQCLFAGTLSLRVKWLHERLRLGSGTSEEAALALTGRGKTEDVADQVILYADQQGSIGWENDTQALLSRLELDELNRDLVKITDDAVEANHGRPARLFDEDDSLLVLWRLPEATDVTQRTARFESACRAALDIQQGIDRFNERHPRFRFGIRMGLNQGQVFGRLTSSRLRRSWKREGRAINAAARLEALNRELGTRILINGEIAQWIDSREFFAPELGTFAFADATGRIAVEPMRVHGLHYRSSVDISMIEAAEVYRAGIMAMRKRRWEVAIERLKMAAGRTEAESLLSKYIEWCEICENEDESLWRGTVVVNFYSEKRQSLDRYLEQGG